MALKEPKECLAEAEAVLIGIALKKLRKLEADYHTGGFFGNCEVKHIAEMVRICHQVRSLLA